MLHAPSSLCFAKLLLARSDMTSRTLPALLIAGVVTSIAAFVWFNRSVAPPVDAVVAGTELTDATNASESAARVIELPEIKEQAGAIELTPVQRRTMQVVHQVPGRLRYDDNRHIQVKIPTAGVLVDVRVKPGDTVKAGQVLAVLNSPEIGNARADLRRLESEVDLAQTEYQWKKATCDGLEQLVTAVKADQSAETIRQEMESVSLGAYREKVVTAYTRYRMARTLDSNLGLLPPDGALPRTVIEQRRTELNASEAALQSVMEQSLFQSRQECASAEVAWRDSQRRLEIALQHLNSLLGYSESAEEIDDAATTLSHVEVKAALAGTIEARHYSVAERVEPGDCLFVLADTSVLWVAADIREHDWAAVELQQGQRVMVTTPAMPDREIPATLYYVGREVDEQTNAVPLIAQIENPDGLLRPGQFVRVAVPIGEPRDVCAVPSRSIVEHDRQAFLFVADQEHRFRRVDVEPGMTEGEWTEVKNALDVGLQVVSHGAFFLKSELLLAGEEE
jgi:cobalt-zinc-cadmium efflux system membrane fusion protein